MAWTDSIPAVSNKISVSIPAIEGNFAWLKTALNNDYKDWTSTDIGMNTYYYPDPAEADQGVTATGSSNTLFDLLTTIGGTKNAALYLRHKAGSGNTTTYQFKTSLNIPDNVALVMEPGALIDADTSICDGGSAFTWTNHSGSIYKLDQTISSPTDIYESGTALTEVADVASITGAGKWCWYGSTVYVWTTGSADPDSLASGTLLATYSIGIQGSFLPIGDTFKYFNGYGSVTFVYIPLVRPEWWGAIADGATECAPALQSAITCAGSSNNIPIHAVAGTYLVSTGLSTNKPVTIIGAGSKRTIISTSSAIRMLDINKDQTRAINGIRITGVMFDGNSAATSGIHMEYGAYFYFEDVEVREVAGIGLNILGFWDGTFNNCRFMVNGDYATSSPAIYIGSAANGRISNSIKFIGHCIVERSNYSAIIIERSLTIKFLGIKIHGHPLTLDSANSYDLVRILGSKRIVFIAPQIVNNRRYAFYVGLSDSAKSNASIIGGTYSGAGNYNITPHAISAITQANPAEVTTVTDHGLTTGDFVYMAKIGGMTELNHVMDDKPYKITEGSTTKKFTLDGVDSSLYSAYTNRGFVVNAADTNHCWNIYVAAGSVVVTGNNFYWVAGSTNCTLYDSTDLTYPSSVYKTGHDLDDGEVLYFTVINNTTGISINTTYYVVNATDVSFQLASTPGGSPLALTVTGAGSGTYVLEESLSYTCLGGDVFVDGTNDLDVICGFNYHYPSAGHSELSTQVNANNHIQTAGCVEIKRKAVGHSALVCRVEDGETSTDSVTRDYFDILSDGTHRWMDDTGTLEMKIGRTASNLLRFWNSGLDGAALRVDRLRLSQLDAEPTDPAPAAGDIVCFTVAAKGAGNAGIYLYDGSAWVKWYDFTP